MKHMCTKKTPIKMLREVRLSHAEVTMGIRTARNERQVTEKSIK